MRERVTFIHPPGDAVDPKTLNLKDTGLIGPQIRAVKENRITATLAELPTDLAEFLRETQEIQLRWSSPLHYDTLDPFSSRLSPGLHLFYKPLNSGDQDLLKLCQLLQIFGPIDCKSSEAFTKLDAKNAKGSPWNYFYHAVENLLPAIAVVSPNLCTDGDSLCPARLRDLPNSVSLDISYDATTEVLKVTSLSALEEQAIVVVKPSSRRVEVGLLGRDSPPSLEDHELGVSGTLVVVGEQKEPSATLFAFPARHRLSDATFSSKFLSPTGLHPTLQLTVSSSEPPREDPYCVPYAHLTLPKAIFADRYQLDDGLFLASKNLTASRYTSLPVDLEAPAYTTETWGSHVLLELAPPKTGEEQVWAAEVPLHLRYLEPSETGESKIEVPYPVVFWACESDHGGKFDNNPFDRVRLGYDNLFDDATTFWHVSPKPEEGSRLTNSITVPILKDEGAQLIRAGTAAIVGLGFAWVLWVLIRIFLRKGHSGPDAQHAKGREDRKNK